MADIFISYSTKDIEEARTIRSVLLQNGFTVFMAPDSIPGGSNYTKEIPAAIRQSELFLLILSNQSQNSIWVSAEVENAFKNEKTILPFVLENCPLNDDFDFLLSRSQRIVAYEKKTEALESLVERIKGILGKGKGTQDEKPAVGIRTAPRSENVQTIQIGNSTYVGELANGKPHGKGQLSDDYGNVYEGDFVAGVKEGYGIWSFAIGQVYEGEFVGGCFHGQGKLLWDDGLGYVGEFANGKPNGMCKLILSDRTYEGFCVNGTMQGKGKIVYPDGRFEEAEFVDGKPIQK